MSKVLNWTKRPIAIQAICYESPKDFEEIENFVGKEHIFCTYCKYVGGEVTEVKFSIITLGGCISVSLGEYIIKTQEGFIRVCDPKEFEKLYIFHSNVQEVEDVTR